MKKILVHDVQSKIYTIRGKKVILDRDLSVLYDVPTSRLNEQYRRNIEKFPNDFAFNLTEEELKILRSQNAILEVNKFKYLPTVFTEHGVLMISNVLKSEIATRVSIEIIRVFIRLKEQALLSEFLNSKLEYIENLSLNNREDIEKIFGILNELIENPSLAYPENRKKIGLEIEAKK